MTNEYRFGYDEMLIQIQACVPDSQNRGRIGYDDGQSPMDKPSLCVVYPW